MPTDADLYRLASLETGRSAIRTLEERFITRREKPRQTTRSYLDTFDWRLHRNGALLVARTESQRMTLDFTPAASRRGVSGAIEALPAFADGLPPGRMRDLIAPISSIRRLLPVAVVATESESIRVLDKRRKTVARVQLEERAVEDRDGSRKSLPVLLRIDPLKGYDQEFGEISGQVQSVCGLRPEPTSELVEALAAVGREPGDYSSKIRVDLAPESPAALEVRRILRVLLDTLLLNEDGLRRDLDTEFLHDFRVAVRRTRTALTQIRGLFAPSALETYKPEFSWLGRLTGPTRDLDVYLMKMPGYRETLPASVSGDLEPLSRFLEAHRTVELRRLLEGLDSPRFGRLVQGWSGFLNRGEGAGLETPFADRPVREVASREIRRVHKRLIKKGRAINNSSPATALHRLRIDGKKLRYLLEFFRSLYDPDEMDDLIGSLKRLQDNLGDFNDFGVQQGMLSTFGQQMLDEGFASARALMAMGRLVDKLEKEEAAERSRFAKRFAEFDSKKNRRRYKSLLEPRGSR